MTANGWLVETDTGYAITKNGMEAFLVWKSTTDTTSKVGDTLFSNVRIDDAHYDGITTALLQKGYICNVWNGETRSEQTTSTRSGYEIFKALEFYLDVKLQKSIARKQKAGKIAKGIMTGLVKATIKITEHANKMNNTNYTSKPKRKYASKPKRKQKTKPKRKYKPKRKPQTEPKPMFGDDFEKFWKI